MTPLDTYGRCRKFNLRGLILDFYFYGLDTESFGSNLDILVKGPS